MALPWLRIFDAVIGLTDLVILRKTTRPREAASDRALAADESGVRALGNLEARLASVVVAALKEAFDRDNRRLDFERQQAEAERLRAERALRQEVRRQAIDREVGRLRLVAGLAVASWLGALFLGTRIIGGAGGATRVFLGAGWAFLLAALAVALGGQMGVARRTALDDPDRESGGSSATGALAAWLLVLGLALVGVAALLA